MTNDEQTSTHPLDDRSDAERWARTMAVLGRVVVVTAVVATIAALALVQRLSVTYRDGLIVTEASAALVADSIAPLRTLADDLTEFADTVVDGLAVTAMLIDTTQATLADLGDAARSNLADTATASADIADRLAATLETIERFIPGDRNSIAEELRAFADGLEPVAEQLRTTGDQLGTLASDLDSSQATLDDLASRIDVIATDISELGPSFDALAVTAADLQVSAAAASERADSDLWLARILIVAIGAVFVAIGVITERFARAWVAPGPATSP